MPLHGFKELTHEGSELVLAAHYNSYGTRLVTGSADHKIRVFDLDDEKNWVAADAWRGHNGEVLDVRQMLEIAALDVLKPPRLLGKMERWIRGPDLGQHWARLEAQNLAGG